MLSATTNTAALTAQRFLGQNSEAASSSIAKMSSGSRIVKASDDASSLAIGNKIRADVASLDQASRNASQGASLLQVANGAVSRINDILTRLKTLSTQVVNGTLSTTERQYAQQEFSQLRTQIDDITTQTRWNGVSMLNGGNKTSVAANALGANINAAANGTSATTPGAGTYFDNTGGAMVSNITGTVEGFAEDVTVTALASQFIIEIEIGGQTFQGFASGASNDSVEMISTMNDHNSFTMDITNALPTNYNAADETAIRNDLLAQLLISEPTKPPVSFGSAELTSANIQTATGVTFANDTFKANGATEDGTYMLTTSYDAGLDQVTLRVHNADNNKVYDAVIDDVSTFQAGDTNVSTFVFGNGLEVRLENNVIAGLDAADIANGVRIEVEQGTATTMEFQVGDKSTDLLNINFISMTADSLGLTDLNIETADGGKLAGERISEAISKVNNAQAQLGAIQSRMEYVEANLLTITENLKAAQGIFLDVDMAAEMTEFTKNQTLMQAGVAMLSQANQMPQNLLQLIQ